MDNYSLSDIAAVTEGGFGGNNGGLWTLLILFALFGGGFGFGGNTRGNVATQEDVSAGFNFVGVNNSLKDLMLGQANINQNLGNAICSSTYELGSKIDNCCCNTQLAMKDVTATIISENAETRKLIQNNKIESLQAQVNQLQLAQAMCGVPKINTYAYGVAPINYCTNGNCAF